MNVLECLNSFKKTLANEMSIEQHNEETLKQIKYVMRYIKEHLEYLRTYKEII